MKTILLVITGLLISGSCYAADIIIFQPQRNLFYEQNKLYQDQAREIRKSSVEQARAVNDSLSRAVYGIAPKRVPYQEPPVVDIWEPQQKVIIEDRRDSIYWFLK